MSYLIFSRKWRPQTFDEVVGQDHAAKTLKNALSSERLAHAYIFSGPRGVGKTSTARILAKALNCQKGINQQPCNECFSCKEITEGRSLDVLEIDGASNRGIDEIRQLKENVKFSPAANRFKVYIIDEVHMLTMEAFNALLKTLEEPPAHVKFIFATTLVSKVPSTILSRCQRFDFKQISIPLIIEKLKEICVKEKVKVDEQVLTAVAKAAEGSLRDGESILDQLISYNQEKVSLKDVSRLLGLIEQDILFEFGKRIIEKDPASLIKLLDMVIAQGKDLLKITDSLIEYFRNMMLVKISGEKNTSDLVDLPREFIGAIAKQCKELELSRILGIIDVLFAAKDVGKRLNSLRIPLELALVKLSYNEKAFQESKTADPGVKISSGINNERGFVDFSPPVTKERAPDPDTGLKQKENTPDQGADFDKIRLAWPDIIEAVAKKKMSAATYLKDSRPESIVDGILTISFLPYATFQKESLERKENKEIIEEKAGEFLKEKIRIGFIIKDRPIEKIEENNKKENFIEDVLNTFKGRVI